MGFIGEIALILISALLAATISVRIGLPAVIGELLAGVILGPGVLNLVTNSQLLSAGSELGVILLMFIAGVESDLTLLKKYIKPSLLVASIGVIFPMIAFYGYGLYMNQGFERAIFWGVIFSATSVSISVEVLREFKKLNTKEGATVLGAAVADDIMAVLLLSIFISSFGVSKEEPLPLWLSTLLQVLFFVGIYVFTKWIIPFLMDLAQRQPVSHSVAISSMFLCLIMAFLADIVGLSSVVGAFFAGVAVAQTKYKDSVASSISSVGYTFFIPIFFISIGLEMKFDGFLNNIGFIIIMTVLAILTKLIGCGLGAKFSGMNFSSSLMIGSGMVSRGEMALIIAQLGLSAKLIAENVYSEIIVVIVLTTIVAPFMLKFSIARIDDGKDEVKNDN